MSVRPSVVPTIFQLPMQHETFSTQKIAYIRGVPDENPKRSIDPEIVLDVLTGKVWGFNRNSDSWGIVVAGTESESDGATNTALAFSESIPLTQPYSFMSAHQVSGALEFSPNLTGRQPGAVTLVRLLADGTNEPTFDSITEINTSAGYDNTENILNHLVFFYDGVRVMVNIFQDVNAQPADIVPPELQSAAVSNSVRDRIVLTYGEALNVGSEPDAGDFSVPGKTVESVSVQGSTVYVFVDEDFGYGDSITISYTQGSNEIQDIDGNLAESFSSEAVTNNIAAPDATAPEFQSASVEDAAKDVIVLVYDEDLNAAIVPATTDFAVSGGKAVTDVSIVDDTVELTVNSEYEAGDVITVSYTPGSNKLQDADGNLCVSLSSESVTNNVVADFAIVAWENLVNATDSGGFINYTSAVSGGRGTISIDPTIAFEVKAQLTSLSPATVVMLDEDSVNAYVWGASQAFAGGFYHYPPGLNIAQNGTAFTEVDGAFSPPKWGKMRKSGNNIIFSVSADDVSYSDLHTFTGALTGLSVLYIHVLFAANSAGDKIQVFFKAG